jgi:uncharacterized protein YbaP (TraB family)
MSLSLLRGKSVALSLLACVLVAPVVHAWAPASALADAQAAPASPASAKATPKPLLWKVSDKDNALYLLGSFHMLKENDYPLSGDVDKAFADAENVVFEVPPSDLTDPSLGLKMQQIAAYNDGRTLTQVLPADVRDKMGQMLGQDHLAQLDAIEPWFINLSLLVGVSQQMGFKPEHGLDMHIARLAETAGKPVSGLETADQQLAVLDASPMEEQISGLREFFNQPGDVPKLLNDTHEAWRNGDVERLGALVIDEVRTETPVTYRIINVERNDAWVPQLQQMLDGAKQGNTMVVVGAMHLLGSDGVVDKLRAKGYKVERICSACTPARP